LRHWPVYFDEGVNPPDIPFREGCFDLANQASSEALTPQVWTNH
jgi:hypothetical protein